MTKHRKLTFAIAIVLAGIVLAVWWADRPRRISEKFVSHLSHQRYEDAALMIRAPSAIKTTADGSLILIDHNGNSRTVPMTKLPFLAGGGKLDQISNFTMTALGNSTNGVLDSPPVIIYLGVDGGKIRIDRTDSQ